MKINAAKLCGVDNTTGSIDEGLAADLVVLDGNPLNDISALKKVTAIFQDGKILSLDKIFKLMFITISCRR